VCFRSARLLPGGPDRDPRECIAVNSHDRAGRVGGRRSGDGALISAPDRDPPVLTHYSPETDSANMRFYRLKVRAFSRGLGRLAAVLVGLAQIVLLLLPAAVGFAEVVDRIVAIVNNEVISLYELNKAMQPYIEQVRNSQYPQDVERQLTFEVRGKILNEMINEKLADQELKRQNISVSDKEVDSAIERIKESRAVTDEELRKVLAAQGMTYEEYRQQTEQQILRAKLVNREVRSKIIITEQDIKAYYDQHAEEYTHEKKYHLRNIYVHLSSFATDADRREALRKMETVQAELKAGKPIDELAKSPSHTDALVESDDMGLFKLDDLSPQLKETIRNMKPGDFTPVIEAPFGYQILLVEEIVDTAGKTQAQAAAEIEDKLFNQIVDQKYQSWLQDLRDRAHIKIIN
jgi:peptidyl-prolyl cis-trans isomerase SurA